VTTAAEAEVGRAAAMIDLGRHDQAALLLGRVVAAAPEHGRAWCLLARALLGGGRHGDAVLAARRASALNPADDWPHRLASTALIGQGKAGDALAEATQARALAPNAWRPQVCLAQAAMAARKLELAADAAGAALAIAPGEPDVHFTAGRVALASGDAGTARSHQARALAIDPAHSGAMNELGRISLKERNAVQAVGHFLQAARAAPGVPVFGHNTEVALLRVLSRIIYVCSLAVLVLVYARAGLGVAWGPLGIVAGTALLLVAGYGAWQVRRLPGQARAHLSRMIRRRRVGGAIAVAAGGSFTAVGLVILADAVGGGALGALAPELEALAIALVAGSRLLSFAILRRAARERRSTA
jgi:tetratricopeptide (TPR) repeat protein